MQTPIKKILILVAMQTEANPIIDALKLSELINPLDATLPFKSYELIEAEQHILLMVSGIDPRYQVDNIGTQPATLIAYVGIQHFQPDLVISAGTAGGFASLGAKIGTVYLSDDEFLFHDRQIPLAGFDQQGAGHYPATNVRALAKKLNLPFGKISSGSSFTKYPDQLTQIEKSGAVAKEMEAAAIAWVCWLKQTPLMAVKSITNLLDRSESSERQFNDNFAVAVQKLTAELRRTLDAINGSALGDLAG